MRNVMRTQAHADVLRLEKDLVAPSPALASGAGGLGAAERLAQIAHVLAVDEAHTRLDGGSDAMSPAEILAPDIARKPVLDVIRLDDCVGLVLERDQAGHGAEDFLLRNAHAIVHVGEDRGRYEIAPA